jgi:tRNA U34 5-methylaminomethyl-2-thiouridine-forming methyltransferase MnmC
MAELVKEETATCIVCQTTAPVNTMHFVIGDVGACSPEYARRCFTAYVQLDGHEPTEDELVAAEDLMQSLFTEER